MCKATLFNTAWHKSKLETLKQAISEIVSIHFAEEEESRPQLQSAIYEGADAMDMAKLKKDFATLDGLVEIAKTIRPATRDCSKISPVVNALKIISEISLKSLNRLTCSPEPDFISPPIIIKFLMVLGKFQIRCKKLFCPNSISGLAKSLLK